MIYIEHNLLVSVNINLFTHHPKRTSKRAQKHYQDDGNEKKKKKMSKKRETSKTFVFISSFPKWFWLKVKVSPVTWCRLETKLTLMK